MPILHQIDSELAKLERMREIVSEISGKNLRVSFSAPPRKRKKPANQLVLALEPVVTVPEPTIALLPPRPKREYAPRVKAHVEAPKALGAAVPNRPVFVPKAAIAPRPEPVVAQPKELDLDALEAAIRQNLLGRPR